MTDDALLLRRYVEERSEAAFTELVSRHLDLVYSAALRRTAGDEHDAADVAQQVFAVLARDAAKLARHPALTAWLYAATRNAALKLTRSEQRRRQREAEAQRMQLNDRQDAAPNWETLRPVLDEAMDHLGDTDRAAILLRFFERRAFSDIGVALNVSTDAARMRTERALEKLRGLLVRRGIGSTSSALGLLLAERAVAAAPVSVAAAITGKVVGVGPIASGLLMTKQTIAVTVLVAGAIGTAVYQWNATRRAEAQAAAFARERNRVAAQLRITEERAARAERSVSEAANALEQQKAESAAAAAARASTALPTSSSGSDGVRVGEGRFGFRPAHLGPPPEATDADYFALYQKLGFDSNQRAMFKALYAQYGDRQKAYGRTLPPPETLSPQDRAETQRRIEARMQQIHDEFVESLRGAFGEPAVQAYGNYQDTGAARAVTRELSGRLMHSETPLTPNLAEQLVDIIARNSRSPQGGVALSSMNVDAVLAEASPLLTPTQLAALHHACVEVQSR